MDRKQEIVLKKIKADALSTACENIPLEFPAHIGFGAQGLFFEIQRKTQKIKVRLRFRVLDTQIKREPAGIKQKVGKNDISGYTCY